MNQENIGIDMFLDRSKELILKSDFSAALVLLKDIEKTSTKDSLVILESLLLQVIVHRRLRNYSLLADFSKRIYHILENVKNEYPIISLFLEEVNESLKSRKTEEELLLSALELPVSIQDKVPMLLYIHLTAMSSAFDFPVKYAELQRLFHFFLEYDGMLYYVEILISIAWFHLYRWENKIAMKIAEEALELFEELNDLYGIIISFSTIASIYADIGNNKLSIDYALKYLRGAKELDIINIKWHAFFSLALYYAMSGDIVNSLMYDTLCSELEQHPNFSEFSTVPTRMLVNINITWKKGDIDKALEQLLKLLDHFKHDATKYSTGMAFGVLGEIFYQKGDLEKASFYFMKGLEVRKNFGGYNLLANNFFELLQINLERGMKEKAINCFNEIKKLKEDTDEIIVNQLYTLSKALLLKSNTDERSKTEAKNLLLNLISEEMTYHKTIDRAYIHLFDIILEEIKTTSNLDLLPTLNNYINEFVVRATYQQSYLLLIEIIFLQSKILILELKVEESLELLEKSQQIAKEKGLTRLEILLSNEYDTLLDQLDTWDNYSTYLPTLEERFSITHIEDLLNQIIRQRVSCTHITQEKEAPGYFLILNQDGNLLYTDSFSSIPFDKEKIPEILLKIREKQLDLQIPYKITRLKFREYSCLLATDKNFIFCYIFIGKSFLPMKKLDQFFTKIQDSVYFNEASGTWILKGILSLEDRNYLSNIIERTFLL